MEVNLKRNIEIIIVAILLCIVFTKALFSTYQQEQVMTMDGNIYLLQYGSYINEEVMKENIKKLDNYIVVEEDEKYYVYVGAFINLDNAYKMQEKLKNNNIYTYIKNDYLDLNIIDKIKKIENKNIESDKDLLRVNTEILNILKKIWGGNY